jgi:hypothetical protein
MTAFHSMLHRACNLPLSREIFEKEVAYIKETTGLNGYTETTIDGLMSEDFQHHGGKAWHPNGS